MTESKALQRAAFRHLERLRVRWVEVDLQQIVFNGHYLMYFDTAVAGYWRAMALPYHDTMAALAGDLYVRKATVEYEGSARYDEQLEVGIRCTRIGKSSMLLQAAVFRGETRLVHGDLVYVFADPASQHNTDQVSSSAAGNRCSGARR
jgi:YbgC/YbaW family acyl-CoA thioester hydrolase